PRDPYASAGPRARAPRAPRRAPNGRRHQPGAGARRTVATATAERCLDLGTRRRPHPVRLVQLVEREPERRHERLEEVAERRVGVLLQLLEDRLLRLLELLVAGLRLLEALQVGADLVGLLDHAPRRLVPLLVEEQVVVVLA